MKDIPHKPAIYRFEVIRHMVHEPGQIIHCPEDMRKHLSFMEAYDREHILRVDLNNAHETLGYETVCIGTDNMSMVGPKEVFRGALLTGASCIILVHNHPSGQIKPSSEDNLIAEKLKCLGTELELPLLDMVIIGRNGNYYSFAENELL